MTTKKKAKKTEREKVCHLWVWNRSGLENVFTTKEAVELHAKNLDMKVVWTCEEAIVKEKGRKIGKVYTVGLFSVNDVREGRE